MDKLSTEILATIFSWVVDTPSFLERNETVLRMQTVSKLFYSIFSRPEFWNCYALTTASPLGMSTQVARAIAWFSSKQYHRLQLSLTLLEPHAVDIASIRRLVELYADRWNHLYLELAGSVGELLALSFSKGTLTRSEGLLLAQDRFVQLSYLEIKTKDQADFAPFRGIDTSASFPALHSLKIRSDDTMEWLVAIPSVKTLTLLSFADLFMASEIRSRLQLFPAIQDVSIVHTVDIHDHVTEGPQSPLVLSSLCRLAIGVGRVFRTTGKIFHLLDIIEAPNLEEFHFKFQKDGITVDQPTYPDVANLSSISRFLNSPCRNRTLSSVAIMFPALDVVSDNGLLSLAQQLTSVQSLRLCVGCQSYKVLLKSTLPNISSLYLAFAPRVVDHVQEALDDARSFLQGQSRRIELTLNARPKFRKGQRQAAETWLQEAGFQLCKETWLYRVRLAGFDRHFVHSFPTRSYMHPRTLLLFTPRSCCSICLFNSILAA